MGKGRLAVIGLAAMLALSVCGAAFAQESKSAPLAKQLASALTRDAVRESVRTAALEDLLGEHPYASLRKRQTATLAIGTKSR